MEILETKIINFNGENREYDIVDRNIGDAPKYFIGYGEGLPFISDEVPEEYREHMIFHELTEFENLKKQKNDKCLTALMFELERVPQEKRKEYIKFRRDTFRNLIEYLERKEPESSFIPETKKSFDYLSKLIA